jgi:multidrug efflux pump subunit AcrB
MADKLLISDKELLRKIRELRRIQPRKDWVLLTKSRILGEEFAQPKPLFGFFRLAYAGVLTTLIVFGLFGFARYSLPGDFLYYVKRAAEKSRAIFVSAEEKPQYELEMTNKRLGELNKIAETNQVENIAPALNEFKKTKSAARKSVSNSIKGKSEREAIKIAKQVARELNEINKGEERVFGSLGIDSEANENGSVDKIVIELLLKDAENSTLTEKQAEDLVKAKGYYESGDYTKALETYLTNSLHRN